MGKKILLTAVFAFVAFVMANVSVFACNACEGHKHQVSQSAEKKADCKNCADCKAAKNGKCVCNKCAEKKTDCKNCADCKAKKDCKDCKSGEKCSCKCAQGKPAADCKCGDACKCDGHHKAGCGCCKKAKTAEKK